MLKINDCIAFILGSMSASLLINYCNSPKKVEPIYEDHLYLEDRIEKELEDILKDYFDDRNISIDDNLENYFKLKHIFAERPDLYNSLYEEEILTSLARKYNSLDGYFYCADTSYFTQEEKEVLRNDLIRINNDRSDIDSYLALEDVDLILDNTLCQTRNLYLKINIASTNQTKVLNSWMKRQ